MPGDRQRDDGAERHPAEMPAARRTRHWRAAAKANTQAIVTTIQCRAGSDAIEGAAISSTPPPIQATVPACQTSRIRVRRRAGSMVARGEHLGFAEHAVDQGDRDRGNAGALQQEIAHRTVSIQYCMVYAPHAGACQYSGVWWTSQGTDMTDQLSAKDWLDQGLKALARSGFTALKAEPLAKAMGVSRGSFYWHFADIGAFHAAILDALARGRRRADHRQCRGRLRATKTRCRCCCAGCSASRLTLENAVRSWATRRSRRAAPRCRRSTGAGSSYVESLLGHPGLSPDVARARAQILYWAFLGFALSDQPLPRARQQAVLDELLRIASRIDSAASRSNMLRDQRLAGDPT